ncbi:MAG: oligopeptide transporter, OPT family [Planctomycetes bacterium]|nr:oligopeptide transporter, OPT family [Planctomycetota bacterium]
MHDGKELKEFTLRALLCGLVFGCLFGAANAYLGLKAGLTVSTSIPIAVLSAAVLKLFARKSSTLLEANLAQTVGSASSSLASGTIFTIPALYLWGIVPPYHQIALLALAGGLLGILAMVPLRRLLIVDADRELPYPEGRACAEVLRATERGGGGGRWIFIGIALGAAIKLLASQGHFVPEQLAWALGNNALLSIAVAPALLAVGFIVGFRASAVMVSGGLIASLVLYPLVTKAHAYGVGDPALAMTSSQVKSRFLIYVGAGAVAAAGLVTVIRTAPTMWSSLRAVLAGLKRGGANASDERTDRDLPPIVLVVGLIVLFVALAWSPSFFAGNLDAGTRVLAACGVLVFGFLFVPVSSRLVGVIGVSSNPTSAMALITLTGTAGVFLWLGWRGLDARAAVLTVGTVVCVAASKAGDISQDLKTGFLVRATPSRQQFGQMIAAAVACWAVAGVVWAIGSRPGGFGEGGMPAPQATLMKTVIEAVLGDALPWDLLGSGAALSIVAVLVGLPALPFALGIYLPLATMATVFVGGCIRALAERNPERSNIETGILCASGFVAGEGLAGVFIAGWAFYKNTGAYKPPEATALELCGAAGLMLVACAVLFAAGRAKRVSSEGTP